MIKMPRVIKVLFFNKHKCEFNYDKPNPTDFAGWISYSCVNKYCNMVSLDHPTKGMYDFHTGKPCHLFGKKETP